jgi:transposase-like protein
MGTHPKPAERREARRLRSELGMPIKRIAARLDVSPSSVLYWTKDIKLTARQREQNQRGPLGPQSPERIAKRVESWKRISRERRLRHQEEGRRKAADGDPVHQAGCMLYWAEGTKSRNQVCLVNSDVHMLGFFARFLRISFDLDSNRFGIRLNVYTGNGLSIPQIEDFWLGALELPRTCLRKHTINHAPTSSSGKRKRKLPYGVCFLVVYKSTPIVQHIYGAIQEYAGFEEPRWLD